MATNDRQHQFGACKKAGELFDRVVADMTPLVRNPLCLRLVAPQVASADSIGSNIEEGYGRSTTKDYTPFLVIARGSATETRGRYEQRFKPWLSAATIAARVALGEEIIAIPSVSIRTLRSTP